MADKTREARASRGERRRSRVAEQFEEMDQSAQDQVGEASGADGELTRTAAKVVGSAAAAALLGAAAAVAKDFLERKRGEGDQLSPEENADGPDRANAEPQAAETEERPPPEASESGQVDEEPAELADEDEQEQERAQQHQEPEQQEQEPMQGVSGGQASDVVAQARRQLQGLLGVEPERVSGLARENGGWSVMLEVVEVSRVPESTDVLATYELKLDDDLNIVTVNRQRRYRRSQVDEAS